jgi:hypothetical protein
MSELQLISELKHARSDNSSPWAQDLQTVYFQTTAAQAADNQGPPQGKSTPDKTTPDEKTVDLKTGDKLTIEPDGQGEILSMPNGEKLVFQTQFDGLNISTAWALLDKNKRELPVQYSHTICTVPEVNVSKTGDGGQLEQRAGVSTLSYANGDRIQFDILGITEIKRGSITEHLRPPIVQPFQLPTDAYRQGTI